MLNHGTLVKIMANRDAWNACQEHGKILARLARNLPWIRTLGRYFHAYMGKFYKTGKFSGACVAKFGRITMHLIQSPLNLSKLKMFPLLQLLNHFVFTLHFLHSKVCKQKRSYGIIQSHNIKLLEESYTKLKVVKPVA